MRASTRSRAPCTAALSRAVARMMAQRLSSPVKSSTPPRYLPGVGRSSSQSTIDHVSTHLVPQLLQGLNVLCKT
jgi:hypothetical protein